MAPQKIFHFYTCANVPYKLPNGKIATLAGNYFDTIKNNSIAGCDTLITYIVSHIPISSKNLIVSICSNQYYKMPTGRLINQPGIYYDTLNNFVGCDSIIKVNLKVLPISFKNITDTICKNKPYFFNNNYLSNSGIYFDTLINYLFCDSVIQLNLIVNPNILTNKDYIICQGDSLQIGKHFYTTTNTYYDTLESITTCDTFAITNLNVIEPQVFLQAFPDSLINLGDNVNISALFKYTTDSILRWKSNLNFTTLDFKTIQIKPEEFSTWVYINTITKDGCKASDSLHISITNITLPNAFTPNGDGENDVFIIRGTGLKFVTSFKIFNRWGEVVFITQDGNLGWDGNYKGVPQELGTYIYNVQATFTNGVQKSLKGSLELIR
jgi:gliding motility-associated-like protein